VQGAAAYPENDPPPVGNAQLIKKLQNELQVTILRWMSEMVQIPVVSKYFLDKPVDEVNVGKCQRSKIGVHQSENATPEMRIMPDIITAFFIHISG